ncbi:hypothetical protein [Cecembia calidifontis]|uniref:6-bladed beta-propeller protein n=1 Tax=Cecembia calidifontis TaxID=1187080 RepID=A0A4Q7P8G7_9BACT|nr:hypothetical protein [Cecembia calidifontis]RZS95848.1 hypothetical protein BC751_1397 [Cecembia calidifontis]
MSVFLSITIFISINSFFFTSWNRNENSEIKDSAFYFELVDSVKIEIPYEFGLVFPKVIDGKLLAYSYLDQTFHVLDSKGRLQNSFNNQGEGPKDYTRNLSFVTINNGHLIFMDNKKLSYFSYQGAISELPISGAVHFMDDNDILYVKRVSERELDYNVFYRYKVSLNWAKD